MVRYREFWGERKGELVRESLDVHGTEFDASYTVLTPNMASRFTMRPGIRASDYMEWSTLPDLSRVTDWSGLLEKRKGALIAHDQAALEARMRKYADPSIPFTVLAADGIGPVQDAARFDAARARTIFLASGGLTAGSFRRIALLPFDNRWCFYSDIRPLWNEPRPELAMQQARGIQFLVARGGFRRDIAGFPTFATSALPGDYLLDPNVHPLPFFVHRSDVGLLASVGTNAEPNLSSAALRWTAAIGLPPDADTSILIWNHALAITYSPIYLAENAAGIRQGWPRVPLPNDAGLLRASATLGARLAALLDADTPMPSVTAGALDPALAAVGVPSTRAGAAKDWHLAGWGHRSDKGVTMPGRGQTAARDYAADEAATAAHAVLLGARTLDVGMNSASFWRNMPERVWEAHIGGYQVLKKWLSYRDRSILERPLTGEEVAHVRDTARRLAAILLLGPDLDRSFRACAAAHAPLA